MTDYVILYLENNGEQYFKLDYISSVNLKYWDRGYTFTITTKNDRSYVAGTTLLGSVNSYLTLRVREDILEKDNEEECIPGGLFYLYNKLKN